MAANEKLQLGTVVSNKMDKTVVVRIDRSKRHRLYGKTIRSSRRYKAHDEKNECRLGDLVRIAETRPLSREKRWLVVEVVVKGDVAEVAPRDIGARIIEETREAAAAEAAAGSPAIRAGTEQQGETTVAESAPEAAPEAEPVAQVAEEPEPAADGDDRPAEEAQ